MSQQMTKTDSTPPNTQQPSKPSLAAGGAISAIVPQSVDEYFRYAQAVAQSGLAPDSFKGNPQTIMVAMMAGVELGLAPLQSLRSIAVINGRPAIWGDGLMALARRNGHEIKEWTEGEGESAVAFCMVIRADTGEKIERRFSMAQAVKAGLANKPGPWKQYPLRMLQMRARSWAIRDGLADQLSGIPMAEECQDMPQMRTVGETSPAAALRQELAPDEPPAEVITPEQDDGEAAHAAYIETIMDDDPAEETFPGDLPSKQEEPANA